MKRLTEAIKLVLRAQSVLEDVDRDMIGDGVDGDTYRSVGLPTNRDLLRDCMDKLEEVKNTLEEIQV